MSDLDNMKEFLEKNHIKILNQIRLAVPQKIDFLCEMNSEQCQTATYQTEVGLVCQIPKKKLEFLHYKDARYTQFIGESGTQYLDDMMEQRFIEESIREKNPAIKEIWDQYRLMIHLADESNRLDDSV